MVGVIPSGMWLSEAPEGHSYVVAQVTGQNPLFPVGLTVRCHQFHHSSLLKLDDLQFGYQTQGGRGTTGKRDWIFLQKSFCLLSSFTRFGNNQVG